MSDFSMILFLIFIFSSSDDAELTQIIVFTGITKAANNTVMNQLPTEDWIYAGILFSK